MKDHRPFTSLILLLAKGEKSSKIEKKHGITYNEKNKN